jgi:hypothetical protein
LIELPARLIDLSLAGCMLELQGRPARVEGQSVQVRSVAASTEEWAEGVVLSVRKPFFKDCRIRIAFRDSFPYQSFKMLVYGSEDFRGLARDHVPPHEQDHYWT